MPDPDRKVRIRVAASSVPAMREIDRELQYLRSLLDAATEFMFKPDYGALNDEFSDDPERTDAVTLAWRGPSTEGGDPDRWAIVFHGHWCWSRSKGSFEFGLRPSEDEDDAAFFADRRFTRDEAVELVPRILQAIQAERMPKLQAMVEGRSANAR